MMRYYSNILLVLFLCFSSKFVDAYYRSQPVEEITIPNPSQQLHSSSLTNKDLTVTKNFKPLIAAGTTCSTGCPGGCDVTAGTSGKVMSAPMTLYHIYIGKTAADYASGVKFRTVIDSLAVGLQNTPGSPYMNILSGYTDTLGNTATRKFTFGGAYVYVNSSSTLTPATVAIAIGAAIKSNTGILMDTNAMYQVIFRGDYTYCKSATSCWGSNWCG